MDKMEKILQSIVQQGIFGDLEYCGLKSTDEGTGVHYGSTLTFINLIVRNSSCEEILPLVIKTMLKERIKYCCIQFMMEELMYKEILPSLGFEQIIFPKMYYSNINLENPLESILIFENVKFKQYYNSATGIFLDSDHISLSLKTIAQFHSRSFIIKHENMETFLELKDKIKKFTMDPKVLSDYNAPFFAAIERGVRGFEKQSGSHNVLEKMLRALENPVYMRSQLSKPEEPFDIICHGDFCNNNVMYKYDNKVSPIDCILLDFQLSRYGNVGAELAFFLYMHTNPENREKYWDSYLKIYWDALRESVPNNIELPSYKDFVEHFASKAIYGYIIGSCYIPVVMGRVQYWGNLQNQERIELMKTVGGEKGEKALIAIVSHMLKKRYIQKFLKDKNLFSTNSN